MNTLTQPVTLEGKKWVYWLIHSQPDPANSKCYRVGVVIENEPGYYPLGNPEKFQAPWYWDEATCEEANKELGLTALQVAEIVASSMSRGFVRRGFQRM